MRHSRFRYSIQLIAQHKQRLSTLIFLIIDDNQFLMKWTQTKYQISIKNHLYFYKYLLYLLFILDKFRENKLKSTLDVIYSSSLYSNTCTEQISCYISKCISIILKTNIDTWTTILFWPSFHYWKHFIAYCHQHRWYSFCTVRSVDLHFLSFLLALFFPLLFHSSTISLLRSTYGSIRGVLSFSLPSNSSSSFSYRLLRLSIRWLFPCELDTNYSINYLLETTKSTWADQQTWDYLNWKVFLFNIFLLLIVEFILDIIIKSSFI